SWKIICARQSSGSRYSSLASVSVPLPSHEAYASAERMTVIPSALAARSQIASAVRCSPALSSLRLITEFICADVDGRGEVQRFQRARAGNRETSGIQRSDQPRRDATRFVAENVAVEVTEVRGARGIALQVENGKLREALAQVGCRYVL